MDPRRLKQIVSALNDKNVNQPCPRCANIGFTIVGEASIDAITKEELKGLMGLSGGLGLAPHEKHTKIPTIVVSCNNCGYLSQHAQGYLGLLKKNP